jgi:hypothetical protein
MIPESRAVQRPPEATLLVVNAAGRMRRILRANFVTLLRSGDLIIANDAATLPASLHGSHVTSGGAIEVRLAGWPSEGLSPRSDDRHAGAKLPSALRRSRDSAASDSLVEESGFGPVVAATWPTRSRAS